MNYSEKHVLKAHKLYGLSQDKSTTAEERANAKKKFEAHLEKHSISIDRIVEDLKKREVKSFNVFDNNSRDVFVCIAQSMGLRVYKIGKVRYKYGVMCTEEEYKILEDEHSFHMKNLKGVLKGTVTGYINGNIADAIEPDYDPAEGSQPRKTRKKTITEAEWNWSHVTPVAQRKHPFELMTEEESNLITALAEMCVKYGWLASINDGAGKVVKITEVISNAKVL